MSQRDPYDEPTTGSGDASHDTQEAPVKPPEPVNTGSGDPTHKRDDA